MGSHGPHGGEIPGLLGGGPGGMDKMSGDRKPLIPGIALFDNLSKGMAGFIGSMTPSQTIFSGKLPAGLPIPEKIPGLFGGKSR